MNAEAIQHIATSIIESAYEQAARKASTTVDAIREVVMADPKGHCARYVFDLIACGILNIDTILESLGTGETLTAENIQFINAQAVKAA